MKNWKTALFGGVAGVGLSVGVMLWVQSAMEPAGPEVTAQNNAKQGSAPFGDSGSPPAGSEPPSHTDTSKPHLLVSLEAERYNIVAFKGKFYGLPWGLEVDWSSSPKATPDNGVLIEDDMAALEQKIHAERLKNPEPQLLKSSERYKYNVVAFRGKLYGLPWGLEVDWSQPPEPTPENGVLIDDNMESLQQRIRERG